MLQILAVAQWCAQRIWQSGMFGERGRQRCGIPRFPEQLATTPCPLFLVPFISGPFTVYLICLPQRDCAPKLSRGCMLTLYERAGVERGFDFAREQHADSLDNSLEAKFNQHAQFGATKVAILHQAETDVRLNQHCNCHRLAPTS
jgi:hypothetical protein